MRVEEISTWVEDARKAFASASDLDSLKSARLAHAGDNLQSHWHPVDLARCHLKIRPHSER